MAVASRKEAPILTRSSNPSNLRAMAPRALALHASHARAKLPSVLALALLVPSLAHAQVSGEAAVAAADAAKSNLPPDTLTGEGTFGQLGEDFFATIALRLNIDREGWGLGLQLPVRLRVWDRDPQNVDDFGGIIRKEDWDEVSDFLRVLRYVYVGQHDKKGPYYVRVGELSGLTIGHGTIMYRYFNGLETDIWRTGVNAAVNAGPFGGEIMVGDLVNPYLFGGRFSVRPLKLVMGENFFTDRLVVGTTLVTDTRAPVTFGLDAATSSIAVDDNGRPAISDRKTIGVFGLDVGLELLSTELLSITPYIDLNKMTTVSNGWGLHMGVLWGLHLPLGIDTLVLDARTEYRRVSGDYVGPYFDTAYEIERVRSPGLAGPKLGALDAFGGSAKNGVFFDLLAGFPQFAFIGGEFVDYDGGQADGQLRLSLEIPALEVVKLSAFYYRINVSGMNDLFAIDDRSAIVAQASVPLYSFLDLKLRWWRVWRPVDGDYQSVDDWSVGVGFRLEL